MEISKNTVINKLSQIEKQYNIKILLAVESGSRAWGFPSLDSDYDVRFVYVHHLDWYLSLAPSRDVIEETEGLLDISGWELRKSLGLFYKSNPPLLEWLKSPLVYLRDEEFHRDLLDLEKTFFSPKSSCYHYLQMAKGNYREYLKKDLVRVKKYFYVLRPIFACLWIEKYDSSPPMQFTDLLNDALKNDQLLKTEIEKLLERKISGEELSIEPSLPIINEYLEQQVKRLESIVPHLENPKHTIEPLDVLLKKYILRSF